MKLLLDTHIWVWAVSQPDRLPGKIRRALSKSTNELWLSPISTWEILTLCGKGRLTLKPNPAGWIADALAELPVRHVAVSQEVALATRDVVLPHRDPADVFLAATAMVHHLTLVTADAQVLRGRGFSTLSAR